jgi:hypothetical protein
MGEQTRERTGEPAGEQNESSMYTTEERERRQKSSQKKGQETRQKRRQMGTAKSRPEKDRKEDTVVSLPKLCT